LSQCCAARHRGPAALDDLESRPLVAAGCAYVRRSVSSHAVRAKRSRLGPFSGETRLQQQRREPQAASTSTILEPFHYPLYRSSNAL